MTYLSNKFSMLAVAMLLVLVFTGCSKDNGGMINPDAETLMHDGVTREYILHIPAGYDGSEALPVLFNFHGFGGTATAHMHTADMRALADAENFILVYPQGTELDGAPHWNAALDTPDNKSDADDFGFVAALISTLATNYNVDTERVYACGYSNGAFFSYALACYHSDLVAAIGSVSGTMLGETPITDCSPNHPLAMINFHGTDDGVVPYNGGTGLIAIPDVVDFWIGYNATETVPAMVTHNHNGTIIEHYAYNGGTAGVSIEHFKLVGGQHVWFEMNYLGSDLNEIMWEFLSRYDVNGLR